MKISLQFMDHLQGISDWQFVKGFVRQQFEDLASQISVGWNTNHKTDGNHGAIVADRLSLQQAQVGEIISLPYDASRFTTYGAVGTVWTVTEDQMVYLRASRIGQLVHVQFELKHTVISGVDTPDSLNINLPELHALAAPGAVGGNGNGQGILRWISSTSDGRGTCFAYARDPVFGSPATVIGLERYHTATEGAQQWPLETDLTVKGSIWFVCEPDNIATSFVGF